MFSKATKFIFSLQTLLVYYHIVYLTRLMPIWKNNISLQIFKKHQIQQIPISSENNQWLCFKYKETASTLYTRKRDSTVSTKVVCFYQREQIVQCLLQNTKVIADKLTVN